MKIYLVLVSLYTLLVPCISQGFTKGKEDHTVIEKHWFKTQKKKVPESVKTFNCVIIVGTTLGFDLLYGKNLFAGLAYEMTMGDSKYNSYTLTLGGLMFWMILAILILTIFNFLLILGVRKRGIQNNNRNILGEMRLTKRLEILQTCIDPKKLELMHREMDSVEEDFLSKFPGWEWLKEK